HGVRRGLEKDQSAEPRLPLGQAGRSELPGADLRLAGRERRGAQPDLVAQLRARRRRQGRRRHPLQTVFKEAAMSRPTASVRPDPHAEITALILADLEAGVRPWSRPWMTQGAVSRPLRHDGEPYHGVNVLTLWVRAARCGYARP